MRPDRETETSPLPPESDGREDVMPTEPEDGTSPRDPEGSPLPPRPPAPGGSPLPPRPPAPEGSPLPPDPPGREDIIRPEPER
jgi:hypothetical protein